MYIYIYIQVGPRGLHHWSLKTKRSTSIGPSSFQIFASFRQVSQWSWAVRQSRPQKHVDKLDAPVVAACNASGYAQGVESGVPCVPIRQAKGLCKGYTKSHISIFLLNLSLSESTYFPCTVSAQTNPTIFGMTARKHQLYHVALHPCLSVAIKWLTRPNICSYVSEYAATSLHWCQGRIVEPKHTWILPWQEGKSDYATNATNEHVHLCKLHNAK